MTEESLTTDQHPYSRKPKSSAQRYLEQRDVQSQMAAFKQRGTELLAESRKWLEDYHTRPRRTSFDWKSKIVSTKEVDNAKEGQEQVREGLGDAAHEAAGRAGERTGVVHGPDPFGRRRPIGDAGRSDRDQRGNSALDGAAANSGGGQPVQQPEDEDAGPWWER